MKRIIVLGVCLVLSQFSFAEVVVNPDGTAKMQWGGQQGLDNAKKIMYGGSNPNYASMPAYKPNTSSSDDYQPNWEVSNNPIISKKTDYSNKSPTIQQLIVEEEVMGYRDGWRKLGSTSTSAVFINPQSFALDSLQRATMWTKVVNEKKGQEFVIAKALMVADCDSKRIGMSHAITYDRNHNVIDDITVPDWKASLESPDPDSPMYGYMTQLCKMKQTKE